MKPVNIVDAMGMLMAVMVAVLFCVGSVLAMIARVWGMLR